MYSTSMGALLAVALGSGFGGVARYYTGLVVHRFAGGTFPWGTGLVNIVGCALMGFLMTWAVERSAWSPETRLFMTTGLLGGFTTFSTFGYETVRLVEDGSWNRALLNVGLSVILGLIGVWTGAMVVRWIR